MAKKDKPTFNVETNNKDNNFDISETHSFIRSLVRTFQQGAYCLLEALRLVKANDTESELDLMLNDEQHSVEHETKQRFPFIK